jgi:hypothetical protein
MGKNKKKFIDKKRATTYTLVFRSAEDNGDAAPARQLVESVRNVGIGRPDPLSVAAAAGQRSCRYPAGHPLSFLEELRVRSLPHNCVSDRHAIRKKLFLAYLPPLSGGSLVEFLLLPSKSLTPAYCKTICCQCRD